MKTCLSCNQPIEETATYCPYCGQKQETVEVSSAPSDEREKALYVFRRNLRHERKCWSIFGGVWLGFCIFFFGFSLLYLALAVGLKAPALAAFSPIFLIYTLIFLPLAIISLVMSQKITGYLNQLEIDPNPAVERCGGVWLIVMGALFNEIALIFIILNFIHVKRNKDLLLK